MSDVRIRPAERADLARLTEIYNYYVVNTPVTFDVEPYTVERREAWFEQFGTAGRYRLLVSEGDTGVVGYAGSMRFRPKPGYDTTVETTIYCAPEAMGMGIGNRLYAALFEALRGEDIIAMWRDTRCRIRLRRRFMNGLDLKWSACSRRMGASLGSIGMCAGRSGRDRVADGSVGGGEDYCGHYACVTAGMGVCGCG